MPFSLKIMERKLPKNNVKLIRRLKKKFKLKDKNRSIINKEKESSLNTPKYTVRCYFHFKIMRPRLKTTNSFYLILKILFFLLSGSGLTKKNTLMTSTWAPKTFFLWLHSKHLLHIMTKVTFSKLVIHCCSECSEQLRGSSLSFILFGIN